MILCFDIGGSRIKAALATPHDDAPGRGCNPAHDFAAFIAALAAF